MRSTKRSKSHKTPSRHERTYKNRHKNKSSRSWGWNDDLSGLFIDDINEAIRARKARRTDGKGCWKLVPKDSCEVYKDRKKRSATRKKMELSSEEVSNDTESVMDEDKKENRKKLRKKYTKRVVIQSKKSKHKRKKRSKSYSVSACSSQSTCYTNKSHLDSSYY
ncbi:hypothetical protein PYW08_012583 [Mythimna loreyi]|uniref:Uncharacterized protein n=1 Tax=Mythimna loreyi TaxID=667449 RepID=A0ACC2Q3D6_9NEOP|nr:hypothetical protein PYW08_012583 [Mythimna loreyi]